MMSSSDLMFNPIESREVAIESQDFYLFLFAFEGTPKKGGVSSFKVLHNSFRDGVGREKVNGHATKDMIDKNEFLPFR